MRVPHPRRNIIEQGGAIEDGRDVCLDDLQVDQDLALPGRKERDLGRAGERVHREHKVSDGAHLNNHKERKMPSIKGTALLRIAGAAAQGNPEEECKDVAGCVGVCLIVIVDHVS